MWKPDTRRERFSASADVVEPDHLAVGRVQERHAELALVQRQLVDALRVALGLGEHALRAERDLLRLDDARTRPPSHSA